MDMRRVASIVVGLLIAVALAQGSAWAHGSSSGSKPNAPPLDMSVGVDDTQDGELEVLHEDGVNYSRYVYVLKQASGKRIELRFSGDEPGLKTGDQVRAQGKRQSDDTLAVGSANNVTVLSAAALPNTFGVQQTLVILVKFQDNPTASHVTAAQAQSIMFATSNPTSVTNFYRENSYGQTSLTGTVVGPYTIAMNSGAGSTCDFIGIANAAKAKASAAGVSLANYTRYLYAFPLNSCGWWGLGTVG